MAWSAVGVFDFAVLTAMASLTDLPVELLHIIVEQLHDAGYWKALKSLRLTCKVLCDCVNPLLFSTVNINLHHLARASSQLEAFAKERSNVNQFARHLEIMSLEQRYEGHDINALHAAWSNFKASKYICTALQSLENVESFPYLQIQSAPQLYLRHGSFDLHALDNNSPLDRRLWHHLAGHPFRPFHHDPRPYH
ncbi:hypothetical protein BDZ89DRAFT_552256 [Hymenopellis radicata]|nr:hypothetical protein BDZ89DRAFT_552256 [Hymenopellis radicata]